MDSFKLNKNLKGVLQTGEDDVVYRLISTLAQALPPSKGKEGDLSETWNWIRNLPESTGRDYTAQLNQAIKSVGFSDTSKSCGAAPPLVRKSGGANPAAVEPGFVGRPSSSQAWPSWSPTIRSSPSFSGTFEGSQSGSDSGSDGYGESYDYGSSYGGYSGRAGGLAKPNRQPQDASVFKQVKRFLCMG